MAQKDKVKELVGRGLHSYHTKALQQIDRIEKKNKEQNHKISILSNELDNDYLTKTEEGSVVSLEHSKEGMVYLDELQGNTLVNYCTDGSKEMTLNGDIDVEGTFVTTTEGVDNGLVDVVCEGNTLVNLATQDIRIGHPVTDKPNNTSVKSGFTSIVTCCKRNTVYTVSVEGIGENKGRLAILVHSNGERSRYITTWNATKNMFTFSLNSNEDTVSFGVVNDDNTISSETLEDILSRYKPFLLEGDWTNREIPLFFEGMKSVGQDDENGHKIEILSQNKNLLKNTSLSTKTSWYTFNGTIIDGVNDNKGIYSEYTPTSTGYYDFLQQDIFSRDNINNTIKNNKWYTFSFYAKGTGKVRTHIYPRVIDKSIKGFVDGIEKTLLNDGNYDWSLTNEWVRHSYTFKTKSDISDMGTYGKILFRLMPSDTDVLNTVTISCPMLEEGKVATDFTNDLSNKKEILLNKPLRDLPNGLKDKFVKINNKWFIERNTDGYVMNTTENWRIRSSHTNTLTFDCSGLPLKSSKDFGNSHIFMKCTLFECRNYDAQDKEYIMLRANGDGFIIGINRSKLSTPDVDGFKKWLSENRVEVVYKLDTTTYEPLEIEPTLNTYNDITHIYNNSIIPCNMKIKNSGYNAIIKPSTLYTIALDTNNNGTIGMNLGGAKVTTTNNVATITTPATLTDDSLRLYGKGIKGSKVRLLEGDKTNWIPSHFEGMKSSFEDKFDTTDNTYKMEILMNNKNLFDNTKIPDYTGGDMKYYNGYGGLFKRIENKEYILGNYGGMAFILNLPKNKTYKISIKVRNSNGSNTEVKSTIFLNKEMIGHSKSTFTTNVTENVIGFGVVNYNENTDLILYDVILSEVIDEYTERKSNKIQFSSIEPLRRVGNSKDRIVFINNKLMIERNTKQTVLVGNVTEGWSEPSSHTTSNKCLLFSSKKTNELKTHSKIYSDRFMTPNETNAGDSSLWQIDREGIGHTIYNDVRIRIDRERLTTPNKAGFIKWLSENPTKIVCELAEPYYEEIPFELQKIILEGYENGTLFFDTNIPPTSTVTYAGETPIVKATKLNKTEVLNNTNDINDNIIPYLMDMDYRVVCLQLESNIEGISMARLFGGAYEMIKRDILSKRLTREEYGYRLVDYFNAGKLTEQEVRELEDLR